MDTGGDPPVVRTLEMLSWFAAIGVGTSLYLARRYFDYWAAANDISEHPRVQEFLERPVALLEEKPESMIQEPVLGVVVAGALLASLFFNFFVSCVSQLLLILSRV